MHSIPGIEADNTYKTLAADARVANAFGIEIQVCSPANLREMKRTAGGVDLQPYFDLITIVALGHAFDVLGDLRLPTFWLSEIFVNLAMHARTN